MRKRNKVCRRRGSLREYLEEADVLLCYKASSSSSERDMAAEFGISKSTIHRMLLTARLPLALKKAALEHEVERYVLFDIAEMVHKEMRAYLVQLVLKGKIKTRRELWEKASNWNASVLEIQKRNKLPTVPSFLNNSL